MIRGLSHVGISVRNLDRSISFYEGAFGLTVASKSNFAAGSYDGKYEAILGVTGASGRVALLKGPGLDLELFEFSYPTPRTAEPNRPVCDHGISHFCVGVQDIDGEYERLKAAGVVFHCPPQRFAGVAAATYGRDPDGNVFELVERY